MFIEPKLEKTLLAPAERNRNATGGALPGTLRSAGARMVPSIIGAINIWLRWSQNLVRPTRRCVIGVICGYETHYSFLSAVVGSNQAARSAGSDEAITAMNRKSSETDSNVAGSVGLTSTSMLVRTRAKGRFVKAQTESHPARRTDFYLVIC
ncbi:MAG: hypothetical protein M3Y84_03535 [Acidobacteriota bacterium]|nr:hypothetical protein [Acidobacteriota bacterium]